MPKGTAVDLSEIEAFTAQPGPGCQVGRALPSLDPDTRVKLEAAIAATHIPATSIPKWLKANGVLGVSHWTLARHRRKECSCGQ